MGVVTAGGSRGRKSRKRRTTPRWTVLDYSNMAALSILQLFPSEWGWRTSEWRRAEVIRARERLHGTSETNQNKDPYLLLHVTKLFLPSIFRSAPPPAPPLLGLWGAPQVGGRHGAATRRLRRSGGRLDDAQVAGVDDDFPKVQHWGLKDTKNRFLFPVLFSVCKQHQIDAVKSRIRIRINHI